MEDFNITEILLDDYYKTNDQGMSLGDKVDDNEIQTSSRIESNSRHTSNREPESNGNLTEPNNNNTNTRLIIVDKEFIFKKLE